MARSYKLWQKRAKCFEECGRKCVLDSLSNASLPHHTALKRASSSVSPARNIPMNKELTADQAQRAFDSLRALPIKTIQLSHNGVSQVQRVQTVQTVKQRKTAAILRLVRLPTSAWQFNQSPYLSGLIDQGLSMTTSISSDLPTAPSSSVATVWSLYLPGDGFQIHSPYPV